MRRLFLTGICLGLCACSDGSVVARPAIVGPVASPAPPSQPPPNAPPPASPTPSAAPSASPSPTAAASASPSPALSSLTASPAALSLTQTGPATFSVREAGYRGQYKLSSSATPVVTVATLISAVSDTTQIAVDALAAGSANITVTDGDGQSVVVTVGVTLTPITIQNAGVQR